MKWENFVGKNGTNKLGLLRVVTNLQLVKKKKKKHTQKNKKNTQYLQSTIKQDIAVLFKVHKHAVCFDRGLKS